MYFPYFRGKQYELISVRENAEIMSQRGFVPIIEPVKESLGGLHRVVDSISEHDGRVVLVVNPFHGDHAYDATNLEDYVEKLRDSDAVMVGIALREEDTLQSVAEACERYGDRAVALIHYGFKDGGGLASLLGGQVTNYTHVFIERSCGKLYRRHFESDERVLVRDGFKRRNNRDYPEEESFSDLHVTFSEEGVAGFGDFLVVGDDYFETGGPAYAVAIHLTFIDDARDDEMFIYHFKSDRSSTPKDPAGKFAEALRKLVAKVGSAHSPVLRTRAVEEFIDLHDRGHFPGLGTVKKLSMNHHIETLADYFERA